MDRPEDFERNEVTGQVYLALTNNTRRGIEANPNVDEPTRQANKHGHIIEIEKAGNDPGATTFIWRMLSSSPAIRATPPPTSPASIKLR